MVYIVLHNLESVGICVENAFIIEFDVLPIDSHIFPAYLLSEVETSEAYIKCDVFRTFFQSYLDQGSFILVVFVLNQYLLC